MAHNRYLIADWLLDDGTSDASQWQGFLHNVIYMFFADWLSAGGARYASP